MTHTPASTLTRRRLLGLLLVAAQAPLGSTMIAIALPQLARDLGADAAVLTLLLVSSYLLVGIILQSPGGRLGDIFGHVRVFTLGQVLIVVGAICGTVANDTTLLTTARVLMAAGGAFVVPAVIAMLRLHVPAERRARVFGQVGAVMGIAAALGPTLGGVLLAWFDWRAIFFISLPLVAVAAMLQLGLRRPTGVPSHHRNWLETLAELVRFDWIGTALQALAIGAILVGVTIPPSWAAVAWIGGGMALLMLFVLFEWRAKSPVVDPRLFARRSYAAGTSIVGLQNLAMYGLLFQLPHLFQQLRGVDAAALGAVLFAMMGCMVVGAPLGGRLAERYGTRWVAVVAALVATAGMALLMQVESLHAPLDALPGLVLIGLGIGVTVAPSQAAAMGAVPASQAGMAAGVMSTMRYIGGLAGMAVFGALLAGDAIADARSHERLMAVFAVSLFASSMLGLLLPARDGTVTRTT